VQKLHIVPWSFLASEKTAMQIEFKTSESSASRYQDAFLEEIQVNQDGLIFISKKRYLTSFKGVYS